MIHTVKYRLLKDPSNFTNLYYCLNFVFLEGQCISRYVVILVIAKAEEDGLFVNAYNDTFWMGDVLPQAEKK